MFMGAIDIRAHPRQCLGCEGALQRDERAVFEDFEAQTLRQVALHVLVVRVLAGRVDDDGKVIPGAADGEIVHHAATLVGEHGVADLALGEAGEVARHQLLERLIGAFAPQARLAHMRHVEQPCLGARVVVLGEDARRVLHRHVVSGEGDHACAKLDVQRVQWSLTQVGVGVGGCAAQESPRGGSLPQCLRPAPPLS